MKRTRSEGECRGRTKRRQAENRRRDRERDLLQKRKNLLSHPTLVDLEKKNIKINQSVNSAQHPPNKRLDLIRCRNIYYY